LCYYLIIQNLWIREESLALSTYSDFPFVVQAQVTGISLYTCSENALCIDSLYTCSQSHVFHYTSSLYYTGISGPWAVFFFLWKCSLYCLKLQIFNLSHSPTENLRLRATFGLVAGLCWLLRLPKSWNLELFCFV